MMSLDDLEHKIRILEMDASEIEKEIRTRIDMVKALGKSAGELVAKLREMENA